MDSVPTQRHPNLHFSPAHTNPNPLSEPPSFFYKQYSTSPGELASEWGENNPIMPHIAPSINGNSKNIAESPAFVKTAVGVSKLLDGSPLRKSTKSADPMFTPGRSTVGSLASGRPPSSARNHIEKATTGSKSPETTSNSSATEKKISPVDVLWVMLNDLTGKDKMAKLAQYSLRLLLHHSRKTQVSLSDEKVNIGSISRTYANNGKVLDLILNFIKSPRAFAKVLVILICSVFSSRLSGFVPGLGVYRHFLRFGKSPIRLYKNLEAVKNHMYRDSSTNSWKLSDKFFSKATLGDWIGFYYNINDDISMLYRVKFLNNKTLKTLASNHEAYAWYCDSWLGMYNAYTNWQKLSQQEFDMKISIQVKQRSRTLSKQVFGANLLSNGGLLDDDADVQALKDIQFRITNAKLDIYKLASDIIFNSYTVFDAKLHFDTVQIWMGISASFLSSVKLYREKRKALASK